MTRNGRVRYELKTPWRNGTSHVTLAKPGKGRKVRAVNNSPDETRAERHAAMTWAQRLKRVFNIEIETCDECDGDVRIMPASKTQMSISG